MVVNWDSSRRSAWTAEGWLQGQLGNNGDNSSALLRRERFSLTFRHVKGYDCTTSKESLQKMLSLNRHDADAWFKLASKGGGEVGGRKYSPEECGRKHDSIKLFLMGA